MAWVEDETWAMEQGLDASLEFELFSDDAQTTAWPFTGWDVNATVSDVKGRVVYPVTVNATPSTGKIKLVFPEVNVNALKTSRAYRWDCLMVAPGNNPADDHHLATGPVTIALRSSRRDP